MSIYIINNRLRFDEKNGSLGLVGSNETEIVLPSPASRLLFVLVTNNGNILTKEDILTEVWERHGWVASNSNLYHYISIIRKSLSKLGEEKIIITIPKVGFRLTAESVSEEKKGLCNGGTDIVNDEGLIHHKVEIIKKTPSPLMKKKYLSVLSFIGFVSLLGVLFILYLGCVPRKENKTKLLAKVDECEVYQLKDSLLTPNDKTIEMVKTKIKKGLLDCSKKSVVYFSDGYNYRLTYYCAMSSYKKNDPVRCINDIFDSEASL